MAGESPEQASGMLTRLTPDTVIAGYRVESRVGSGGMAMVFRAWDEALGRTVALKVLAPALADNQEFRERFIRESRAVAAVDHPHIIPVYAAGEANGVLYLAMRFVTDGDLRSLVSQEGPLPGDRAVALLSPIASALDAAHAAGLVHRDVKPANILVDSGPGRLEHPYLSDFGLAKGTASAAGLTGTGQFMGTPDYAAPEQITGRLVGPRTDQYALACVAYTALTGALPFARGESMAVLWAHVHDPPPSVCLRRRDLPAAVDAVLARALAKAPAERYETCGEFTEALRGALSLGAAPPAAASARPALASLPVPAQAAPSQPARALPAPGLTDRPPSRPVTAAASTLRPRPAAGFREQPTDRRPTAGETHRRAAAPVPRPVPSHGSGREPFWRRRLSRSRLVYTLAAVVVVAGLGGGGWWLAADRYATVPAVDLLPAARAGQALRQAGFQARTGPLVTDDRVPKGDVVAATPSGRARPGATVTLTISQGARMIDVPQIPGGDTVAQAAAALRAAGLTVAATTAKVGAASDPVIGAIAGTSPPAGTAWPENKPVTIDVVDALALPNLVGQNISAIQTWAGRNHVSLAPTQVASGQPPGTVIAQSPAPGTPTAAGQTVSVSVSDGP